MNNSQPPLITISGPPASGKTTLSKRLLEYVDFEVIRGGDIFMEIGEEKGLSLSELTKLSEEDDEIDKEVDRRLKQLIQNHISGEREPEGDGLIVESRLAGWHANGEATLAIYMNAPLKVRVSRIDKRDETVQELKEREKSEAKRYMEYYGIDVNDLSIYDLVIDTSELTKEEMVEEVLTNLREE